MEHDARMDREASPDGVNEQSRERLSEHTPLVDVAAAVAHEVANAVSAIAGWAELGLAGGTDPRQALGLIASCARTAEQAARRMLRLARGDTPDDDLTVIDVSQLSTELVQLLSITARQARVNLVNGIEPALSLRGARGHWFSLLWNLVKNAIEASEPGTTVGVNLTGDDVNIELEVVDQGPGLAFSPPMSRPRPAGPGSACTWCAKPWTPLGDTW
jgi:signal transduction histidine kinase